MDFISNLIKRPISLVVNETASTMDKYQPAVSASIPSSTNTFLEDSKATIKSAVEDRETNHNNNNKPLAMSSYHAGNITEFIDIPEGYLAEFEDILPPPPPSQNTSLVDLENTRLLAVTTPPSPPSSLLTEQESMSSPTTSMKASQTIDELLSHINDNLQQAGLNDDVLNIASPSNKSELSTLSTKTALNNSKLSTSSTTYSSPSNILITNTPVADGAVFENNSSVHTFHIDPVLETGLFDDHHQEELKQTQHQHATKGDLNNFGINKSSNKFVGLTEFDETKIPELPGDLNPNIEDQYNVTFEECFIPTLTAHQEIKVPEEFVVDRTHLLLPTELDSNSSDNETFADCHDEKDALTTTFAEPGNLDATTDLESYQSAVNNTMNSNFNDTMENIANITIEADAHPLVKINKTKMFEETKSDHTEHCEALDTDEPMDIDMNATLEIIQNTSNNIQQVENVLQYAANILQHIEEEKPTEDLKKENSPEISGIAVVANTTTETATNDAQHLEIEQSRHELSLNKSNELAVNNLEILNPESIIDAKVIEESGEEKLKTEASDNLNITVDCVNSSIINNTEETKADSKLNLTLNLNTSETPQKSSAPSSPAFPIKYNQNEGFPRSPKSLIDKQNKSPFLEKSNFAKCLQEVDCNSLNNVEPSSVPNDVNHSFVEPTVVEDSLELYTTDKEHLAFGVDTSLSETSQQLEANKTMLSIQNKRQTFSVGPKPEKEERRTFNIQSQELEESKVHVPTTNKPDNSRRTFYINEAINAVEETTPVTCGKINKTCRRTFNVATEEIPSEGTSMDTSFEPMDVDVDISQNITIPVATSNKEQRSESLTLPAVQQKLQFPSLPTVQQISHSPPLSTMQQTSQSPPLPTMQQRSQSSSLLTIQQRSKSPPLPTMRQRSKSPPLPTMQQRSESPPVATMKEKKIQPVKLSTLQQIINIKEEQISPPLNSTSISQPLPILIQKRPSIRDARSRGDILSAKELTNIKVKDEKDVFVEKFTPSPIEDIFTAVSDTSATLNNIPEFSECNQNSYPSSFMLNNTDQQRKQLQQFEEEFSGNNNLILNPSDFDYLLTKGNNNTPVDRSSLLLKFDPLLGVPVPVNQGQQQQLQQLQLHIPTNTNNPCLSPTLEEDEHNDSNRSFFVETKSTNRSTNAGAVDDVGGTTATNAKLLKGQSQEEKQQFQLGPQTQSNKRQLTQGVNKKNATMSVDVIKDMSLDNDSNKTFENSNSTQSDEKQINYKMDDLEKKIKNEVLKTEDIEKKLKDAEQREEALIKRITEKDKTVAKMTGVIEAYEKAIAELIAEKEQLIQNYEKQLAEVKSDRDSNYHHLTSLETTFSDLHVKYEKSKEMTCQLKASEEALQAEKRKNLENLHLQEQRYEKMKNHAMQQLEIANKKLESLTRDHSIEITKLKALLKKEEIARSSINEQLAQKTKENVELVKICDELIAGQGS